MVRGDEEEHGRGGVLALGTGRLYLLLLHRHPAEPSADTDIIQRCKETLSGTHEHRGSVDWAWDLLGTALGRDLSSQHGGGLSR